VEVILCHLFGAGSKGLQYPKDNKSQILEIQKMLDLNSKKYCKS
jgi:hypothetical protein